MNKILRPIPLLGLIFAVACEEELDCTTIAVASVNLSVVDFDGQPVPDASASYVVDGQDPQACESVLDGFICGWEVAGTFTVTASAPGYQEATGEVTVGADECHVIPESLELVLEPVECTQDLVPSVIATVSAATGGALTGVMVSWGVGSTGADTPCDGPSASGEWRCGEEIAGTLTLEASADGVAPQSETVEVAQDECHVITEHVDFVL